ncbi:Integrator complex subunit 4 [Boothiomyces sp. JEL0866]|nr:Integrator complex subunit 4 [Boothiomyces sp. JEL0866]
MDSCDTGKVLQSFDEILSILKTEQIKDDQMLASVVEKLSDRHPLVRLKGIKVAVKLGYPVKNIYSFLNDPDIDTRLTALETIQSSGVDISWQQILPLLKDYNDEIRLNAMQSTVDISSNKTPGGIQDKLFILLCDGLNDKSPLVRERAAKLLGTITTASEHLLLQTLTKKPLNNDHEHQIKKVKVEDDDVDLEDKVVLSSTFGAFIHGSEDEFAIIRKATIDSMCSLGLVNKTFAATALGFLIDMFNDEDSNIRKDAIHCIGELGKKWSLYLDDDCIKSVILILLDRDMKVRKLAYDMLKVLRFQTTDTLKMILKVIINTLVSEDKDQNFIYGCLAVEMIPVYFENENGFLPKEYKLSDKRFDENIKASVPPFITSKYSYVLKKLPNYIPVIPELLPKYLDQVGLVESIDYQSHVREILQEIIEKWENGMLYSESALLNQIAYLENLYDMDKDNLGALYYCKTLLNCELLFRNLHLRLSNVKFFSKDKISNDVEYLERGILILKESIGLPIEFKAMFNQISDCVRIMKGDINFKPPKSFVTLEQLKSIPADVKIPSIKFQYEFRCLSSLYPSIYITASLRNISAPEVLYFRVGDEDYDAKVEIVDGICSLKADDCTIILPKTTASYNIVRIQCLSKIDGSLWHQELVTF